MIPIIILLILIISPQQINIYYQKFFEHDIINLKNESEREKFFAAALQQTPDHIYSFTFGTINGEYYGARRNEKGEIEIDRKDHSTGGRTWYFQVNEDLSTGNFITDIGYYNPHESTWYQKAITEKKPSFSPIYQHFALNELVISASLPIYKDDELIGVLATHTTLSLIDNYLESITEREKIALIIDNETTEFIANSLWIDNFKWFIHTNEN